MLRLPENPFAFSALSARPVAEAGSLCILPVFSGTTGEDIAADLGDGELSSTLQSALDVGLFKAEPGQTHLDAGRGFMLLGLGPVAGFHPDILAAAFRGLGARLVKLDGLPIRMLFTQAFADAMQSYASLDAAALNPGGLDTGSTKKSDSDDAEVFAPDHLGRASLADVISTAISCTLIGADAMDLLTRARGKREIKSTAPEVYAQSLDEQALQSAVERGQTLGRMVNGARYVASLPGNHFNPEQAETYARSLAEDFGLEIEVFSSSRLEEMGMGGIISVGKGSVVPPRMIVLKYAGAAAQEQNIALVGKGITFDTGGISLKPGAAMHEMKYDMCGAALVLHMMALAAQRKLPINLVGLVGLAENMPSGNATKPGDVYTAYNGVTVEVQNTDAEGRLVLGDVLAYACEQYQPRYLVDFATLTGAAIIALGHHAAGILTPSEDLAGRLDAASRASLDRAWRLPHWSIYDSQLKSEVADLNNIGGRPAGTVTAMRFLAKFVPPDVHWAHVDIAGTAWRDKAEGSQPSGATGWGVRMMNRFLEDLQNE